MLEYARDTKYKSFQYHSQSDLADIHQDHSIWMEAVSVKPEFKMVVKKVRCCKDDHVNP